MPNFEYYKQKFSQDPGSATKLMQPAVSRQRSPAFQKYYSHYSSKITQDPANNPKEFKTNFMSWMDRLMRPTYASANLAKEMIAPGTEFTPGQAIWRGLTGEDKTTYSDVLETVGWQPTTKIGKFARGATGFGLDVLLDPLTYVGVGAITKAGRVASKAGKLAPTVAKQAVIGQRALVSFAGRPIVRGAQVLKGVTKVGEVARRIPAIDKLAHAFIPGFRPQGVTPEVWKKFTTIGRKAKAIQRTGNEKAMKFATGVLDDMKKLSKTKQLTDDGVKSLLNAVERRSLVAGVPDSAKPIWKKLVNYADDVAQRRAGIGKFLMDETDYNYWLHQLSDKELKNMQKLGLDIGFKDWTTKSASDISRQYIKIGGQIKKVPLSQQKILLKQGVKIEQASIGEINKVLGKDFFSTDIPYTSYTMGRRLSRQEGGTFFFKSVRELGSPEPMAGWVKSTAPELEGLYFNPYLAKEIDTLKKAFVGDEVTKGFLRTFDTIQNYWKKQTLGPFPAYHFRNMIGNTWNNYLAGVTDPKLYGKAASIQRRVAIKGPLTKWERKLVDRAEALGVLEQGWFGTVLGSSGTPRYYKPAVGVGRRIADIGMAPAEVGLKAGRQIENNARLAHFIDKVNKGWSFDEAALSVKKYLFDYSELTPFEVNVMRRLMPFYCVSEDTECLTDDGWKKFNEIGKDNKILTYNLETKELQWQTHKGIHVFDYNGQLISFSSQNIDLLCTPNHRCVTEELGIRQAVDIAEYANHCPMVGKNNNYDFGISGRALSLIGWVITDGHYRRNGSGICIYQKKYNKVVEELLGEDYSASLHPDTGTTMFTITGETRKELQRWFQYGLWKLVIQLSVRQCNLLRSSIILADGGYGKKGKPEQYLFIAQQGKYRDLIQLIWFLAGYNCKLGRRGFYERKVKSAKYLNKIVVEYKGKVWCPSTKNTTAIFRRNGIITISGQTWSRKNIPLQIEHIIKAPGRTIAPVEKARKALAGGPEPERKYLPGWLKERYPFRVGQPEAGVTRYFPLESWLPIADLAKVGRPGQAFTELLSPAIKLPTELMMNRSFYFKQPIRRFPGQQKKMLGVSLPAKTEYALRNVRMLNELNRLFEKPRPTAFEATKIDKAVRVLTGIKLYPQRIVEMKKWAKYNIDRQIFELKKGYNRARRNRNFDEARKIKGTIYKLERIKITGE